MVPSASIVIVGTGFSGLGLAIRLKKAGIHDFVLLDRASEVGGVWRDNTYPGCACDVESLLYSFSFAPHARWSRLFAEQPEIWDYLRACADRFGIRRHIRFQEELHKATWDETARLWRLETSKGTLTARVLVSGMGALSEPALPSLPGLERFRGVVFHSARWNHTHDLTARRVAVIGTGASAIQFIPKIQPKVASLTIFQRTAPWILPRLDRPLTESEKERWARWPLLQKIRRLRIFLLRETYGVAFRRPKFMKKAKAVALHHLRKAIKDPVLREKLTPPYEIGCKRVLLSNDYYPALTQANVALETSAIQEVREHGIVTADGVEHALDTIILGTGFQVSNIPTARLIHGREGRDLGTALGESPKAYLGTTFPGFPNFFMLQGPNTGLGHNSVVMMIEAQIEHVMGAIRFMRQKNVAALEPTARALNGFVKVVDGAMKGTVWTSGGCKSWYLDATGRNSTLWPSSVLSFKRRVARFRPGDYRRMKNGSSKNLFPADPA